MNNNTIVVHVAPPSHYIYTNVGIGQTTIKDRTDPAYSKQFIIEKTIKLTQRK